MKTITVKELHEATGLSLSTLQTQLVHFDKYRVIGKCPFQYKYNAKFLNDLKEYYEQKLLSPRYEIRKHYKKILQNINFLIEDYNKKAS